MLKEMLNKRNVDRKKERNVERKKEMLKEDKISEINC